MRKNVALMVVLFLLAISCLVIVNPVFSSIDQGENTWVTKASMQQARSCLGVTAVNGKIYAIGGSTASGWAPSMPASAVYGDINLNEFVGTNEEYDPATDMWTYKSSMPTPRMAFAIAVYNDKIYCIGGRSIAGDINGGYTAVNEVYDPITDTWETKASLPIAAGWLQASVAKGSIYVLTTSGTNYAYDPPTNSWSTKTSAPFPAFNGYAMATLDDKLHVIGGLSSDQHGNLHSVYNPDTDMWNTAQPPPSSHSGGAAGATSGINSPKRIYVFGQPANLKQGEDPDFVRVYNPETDSWEYGAHNAMDRHNFGVASLNDTFYVIGGHTYTFPGSFAPSKGNEMYIPIDYGNQPPEIKVLSLANQTYNESTVSITFTTNKPFSWAGYSINEKENTTVTGNFTLTNLPNGTHNITMYANDTLGNMGASETVSFTITKPEFFPIVPVAAVVVVVIALAMVLSLLLFRRHQKTAMLSK